MLILPRQARDRHRENSKKEWRFLRRLLGGSYDGVRGADGRAGARTARSFIAERTGLYVLYIAVLYVLYIAARTGRYTVRKDDVCTAAQTNLNHS